MNSYHAKPNVGRENLILFILEKKKRRNVILNLSPHAYSSFKSVLNNNLFLLQFPDDRFSTLIEVSEFNIHQRTKVKPIFFIIMNPPEEFRTLMTQWQLLCN